ncbi:flagellar biosynthesis protein FlhF [Marinitoga hydrogenitolerans DSM 16785]|uniref:Flagellar biosynthesis protein FlhF n=1 Tax=Marinitoga hydrogenitolerans (strain DSM 16785 / JCM 12826 / AT1271) TaxID=1122195 RepID=A0A1M4X517_MARH1|nr:flagellar biosynthesis protein FlhF [Marinitoga hydrogenitolerans]SHE88559.1 flagellar biosynthesis protein FlhF [Marinitoga hydrogenitolerans DSM 16785]
MKIKKYIVNTIPEAMEKIREELGENAYILDTKRINKGGFLGIGGKKYIEVTAVLDEQANDVIKNIKRPSGPGFSNNTQGRINEIKEMVERNKRLDDRINRMKKIESYNDDQYAPGKDKLELTARNEILKLIEEQREVSKLIDDDAKKFYNNEKDEFKNLNYRKVTYNKNPYQNNSFNKSKSYEKNNNSKYINNTSKNSQNELLEIKELIEKLSKRVILNGANPLISELIESFKKQDLSDQIIEEIINALPSNLNKENWKSNNDFKNILFNIFKNNFKIDIPNIHGTIMLIGPTGVGKTTTLAKIAALNKLNSNKGVAIATIDLYRIAATEQLKTYAEIMDIPASVCYTPTELKATVESLKYYDILLIDTAGRSHKDDIQIGELKMYIDSIKPNFIFLVISANMRLRDMIDVYNRFSICKPTHLIITKLDETSSYGQIPSLSKETNLPISYITTGQNVPNDIEIPNLQKLFNLFYGELTL